jgi:hypothetical protein
MTGGMKTLSPFFNRKVVSSSKWTGGPPLADRPSGTILEYRVQQEDTEAAGNRNSIFGLEL